MSKKQVKMIVTSVHVDTGGTFEDRISGMTEPIEIMEQFTTSNPTDVMKGYT